MCLCMCRVLGRSTSPLIHLVVCRLSPPVELPLFLKTGKTTSHYQSNRTHNPKIRDVHLKLRNIHHCTEAHININEFFFTTFHDDRQPGNRDQIFSRKGVCHISIESLSEVVVQSCARDMCFPSILSSISCIEQ